MLLALCLVAACSGAGKGRRVLRRRAHPRFWWDEVEREAVGNDIVGGDAVDCTFGPCGRRKIPSRRVHIDLPVPGISNVSLPYETVGVVVFDRFRREGRV